MSKDIKLPNYEDSLLIAQAKLMDEKDARIAELKQELADANETIDGRQEKYMNCFQENAKLKEKMQHMYALLNLEPNILYPPAFERVKSWFDEKVK